MYNISFFYYFPKVFKRHKSIQFRTFFWRCFQYCKQSVIPPSLLNASHGDVECSLNGFIWSIFGKRPFSNTYSNWQMQWLLVLIRSHWFPHSYLLTFPGALTYVQLVVSTYVKDKDLTSIILISARIHINKNINYAFVCFVLIFFFVFVISDNKNCFDRKWEKHIQRKTYLPFLVNSKTLKVSFGVLFQAKFKENFI